MIGFKNFLYIVLNGTTLVVVCNFFGTGRYFLLILLEDLSQSEEFDAFDSTAVQTSDDASSHMLTPTDDSDRSTTTADDISTEVKNTFIT